jgi:hypothetical protein
MRGILRLTVIGGAALAVTAGVGFSLTAAASAGAANDAPAAQSIVEDYTYPGADALLISDQIKLLSGDGHIVYVACSEALPTGVGRIAVDQQDSGRRVCFDVLAPTGVLNLELPSVYSIDARKATAAGGTAATADLTTDDGVHTTVPLDLSHSTPVGTGASENNAPTTLLVLKVTD